MTAKIEKKQIPEFPSTLTWLNTDRPLRISDELRGRVVLFQVWSYSSDSCLQVFADLEYLEKQYTNEPFTVIAVHCARYPNEESPDQVTKAVRRLGLSLPVVVDEGGQLFKSLGADHWPSSVVVDYEGMRVGAISGEDHRYLLEEVVGNTLKEGREKGALAESALEVTNPTEPESTGAYSYPGKVLADSEGRRIFVSDTNHNRIVFGGWPNAMALTSLLGVIGTGEEGAKDGAFDEATFRKPQGMAMSGQTLYVADAGNHLIRKVDFDDRIVTTIGGTGEASPDRMGGLEGTAQGIHSPWDLALSEQGLFIAMAGSHQIWRYDLASTVLEAVAGSGEEGLKDGMGRSAQFGRPTGITLIDEVLYCADATTHAIRSYDTQEGLVKTIVGKGASENGDVDGEFEHARLQFPTGVTAHGGKLYLSDSYNHKIKLMYLTAEKAETFAGTGNPGVGKRPTPLEVDEPGGVEELRYRIAVADTNNHRVVVIDPGTGLWFRLVIGGLKAP